MSIDISNATLDIIEAIKNKQTIKFDYKYKYSELNEEPKTYTVKPLGFFGDFVGFEGTDEEDKQDKFLEDNAHESVENASAKHIWEKIDMLAWSVRDNFVKEIAE